MIKFVEYRVRDRRIVRLIQKWLKAGVILEQLRERLGKFGLELNPEKTRLIEFGRYAASSRKKRGQGEPETFTFLGFTHMWYEP
jgi:hypothetical protein